MRLFLAAAIPEHVQASAAAAARTLGDRLERSGGLDARWIPAGNLHVTVWFFGEVAAPAVPALEAALATPLPVPPFDVQVGGAGAFPSAGRPRVLWLGLGAPDGAFRRLYDAVAERLEPLGYESETRPFAPHLTVARVRPGGPARVHASLVHRAFEAVPADAGRFTVDALTLYESRLSPRGARYDARVRVPLQG